MGIEKISVDRFIALAQQHPVVDVRSEGEFLHAHIPGATNLALFDNEERKVVGTLYKQRSREEAIKKGLEFFGPKMRSMVEVAEKLTAQDKSGSKIILVHCWRGGMRSAGVAWLFDLYGFKVFTLVGGYKAFRNWVLGIFNRQPRLNILGGYTGSGKTVVLEELSRRKEPVVDLEGLAGHRGSAFGNIGLPKQPSQELFENRLAVALTQTQQEHGEKPIWIEDESQRIGTVNVPQSFWLYMRTQPIYFLDIPFENRVDHLVNTYGILDTAELAEATKRIQKRLGGLETKTALEHLEKGEIRNCFQILLRYYDKHYGKALMNRPEPKPPITNVEADRVDSAYATNELLKTT